MLEVARASHDDIIDSTRDFGCLFGSRHRVLRKSSRVAGCFYIPTPILESKLKSGTGQLTLCLGKSGVPKPEALFINIIIAEFLTERKTLNDCSHVNEGTSIDTNHGFRDASESTARKLEII